MKKSEWDLWLEWHKDWKKRRDQAHREANQYRNYKWGEKKELIRQLRKAYMAEFWANREKILGW